MRGSFVPEKEIVQRAAEEMGLQKDRAHKKSVTNRNDRAAMVTCDEVKLNPPPNNTALFCVYGDPCWAKIERESQKKRVRKMRPRTVKRIFFFFPCLSDSTPLNQMATMRRIWGRGKWD